MISSYSPTMEFASLPVDDDNNSNNFIPSSTWTGPREGYYFGTNSQGTGYYRDHHRHPPAASSSAVASQSPPPAKKPRIRRSVQIAEDRNTIEVIPARESSILQQQQEQQQLLLEQAEQDAAGKKVIELSVRGVQTAAASLQKALERNVVQRSQAEDEGDGDAAAYMDSEVNLYEHIAALKSVAADPQLYTTAILVDNQKSNLLVTLCELLTHENEDIVASVIALFVEWLDYSSLVEEEENNLPFVVPLAAAVLRDALDLILKQLPTRTIPSSTLNGIDDDDDDQEEEDDDVGKGAEDILSLVENLLEMDLAVQAAAASQQQQDSNLLQMTDNGLSVAAKLCETRLLPWLVQQLKDKEVSSSSSSSSKYRDRSLELLALIAPREDVYAIVPDWSRIPIQPSSGMDDDNDDPLKVPRANGAVLITANGDHVSASAATKTTYLDAMELLLQVVAVYRKTQPQDDTQVSELENACIVVASALAFSPCNVQCFVKAQGIELVVRCLKERVHAGGLALKWLDFTGTTNITATEDNGGGDASASLVYRSACEHLVVEAGTLKYLFPLLMGRHEPKPAPIVVATSSKRFKKEWSHAIETTTIRMLYSLTRYLQDDSPKDSKQRLLAKFVEEEKCDRLVELCLRYDAKARQAEFNFFKTDVEETLFNEETVQLAALEAKLAGGGEVLHRVCALAAFCCVWSKRCHERILSQLRLQQSGIGLIRDALQEFAANLGDGTKQKEQMQYYLEHI